MGQSFNTVPERLRDTYREAGAKAGKQRAELDVSLCWAPTVPKRRRMFNVVGDF